MPWNIPLSMLSQAVSEFTITIDSDRLETIDLFDEVGQPAGAVDVTVNIEDGAQVGVIVIPIDFASGSTFAISITGNSRVLGTGGAGGRGGIPSFSSSGGTGRPGNDGGSAIVSAFDYSLNADAGFILGGGGGGGGGGAGTANGGTEPFGGAGGGGGQGWNNASGGTGDLSTANGEDGSISAAGDGGTTTIGGDGGAGGAWATSGSSGSSGSGTVFSGGGAGGSGGSALEGSLNPITVTLTGAKTQATLVSEGRLLGGTTDVTVTDP